MTISVTGASPVDAVTDTRTQKSGLRGAIARLAVGKAGTITVGLAAAPLLTRLYTPDNFGTLAILTTILAFLAPSATLSYVRAIPLSPDRPNRRDLVALSAAILPVSAVVLAVVTWCCSGLLAKLYGVPELATYAFVLPLMFLIGGTEQIITMLLNCERKFGVVAIRDVGAAACTAVVSVLVGVLFAGGTTAGLLIGAVTGMLLGALYSGTTAVRQVLLQVDEPLCIRNVVRAATRHRRFPQFANWSSTINAVTQGLPVMLLGLFFSLGVVGLYSMSSRLVTLPLKLLNVAGSQVFYVESADAISKGESARGV